jgi:hypothetical protein
MSLCCLSTSLSGRCSFMWGSGVVLTGHKESQEIFHSPQLREFPLSSLLWKTEANICWQMKDAFFKIECECSIGNMTVKISLHHLITCALGESRWWTHRSSETSGLRQWGGKLSFSKFLWLTFRENPGSVGEDLKVQAPGNFMFFTSSLNKSETGQFCWLGVHWW